MVYESAARLSALPSLVAIPGRTLELSATHLPVQHTPLVGRETELATLRALFDCEGVRLLTLTGPGGVGKTRLALRLADELAPRFSYGAVFVALAGVREPDLTLPAMYQALGGREAGNDFSRDRLHQLLEGREVLLLLDNFEHLVSEAASVSDILASCPRVKIIVTSRSALQLSGEHDFLVPPLTLPDPGPDVAPEDALQAGAVSLFVQRARAARPGFTLTDADLAAVSAICRRLDGLPLAIELAAARINHLSPDALLGRLEAPGCARLPLLTGGLRDQPARHQTMRDTIAWSFALLDERERDIFQRLAVFVDGFSVTAASVVCDLDELDMLDGIGSLVARSLVRYDGDLAGEPRYGMFETIREFGLECLAASGRERETRLRHAAWALALADEAGPRVKGPDGSAWMDALEREHASLRAALAWLAEHGEREPLVRLSGALWPFWEERAHFMEGRQWLETALDLADGAPAKDRMQVLIGAGTMARHQADFAHGIVRHEAALALARELGDRVEEATILHYLGAQATDLGDFAQARARFEACMAIAREAGAPQPLIRALHGLGQIQRVELDSEAALKNLEEVLALARAHQMSAVLPYLVTGIALAATDLGDCGRAIMLFHENIGQALAKGNLGHVIDGIEGLARVAAVTGQARRAALLYGAGEALRQKLTFPVSPTEMAYAAPMMQGLREALGEDGFLLAWQEGRSLTQARAIETALAIQAAPDPLLVADGAGCDDLTGLTERELEVLRLLATGHSNRELGAELFISPTTAARHVANIFNKLGVDSRSKASAYAYRHGLL